MDHLTTVTNNCWGEIVFEWRPRKLGVGQPSDSWSNDLRIAAGLNWTNRGMDEVANIGRGLCPAFLFGGFECISRKLNVLGPSRTSYRKMITKMT